MKKVTFAILGAGNRGTRYSAVQLKYPEEMQVVAVADPKKDRLASIQKMLDLPDEALFDGADSLLAAEKCADIMVIATQDAQHRDHAIRAMEKGYDLLLEKPIAATPEDCRAIAAAAKKYGRRVIICHVLRYTVFYQTVKDLIAKGKIGRVESIQANEQVGYYHYAHSYVRGNWHKEADSSPMILAKCCHDMDLFLWLTGKKCKSVSSYGSLDYFTHENCPKGAPERCMDGCREDCPFHAVRFYLSRIPGWPANVLQPEPTEANILDSLRDTDYGKCVFQMDNDVVDHQVVNLLMEDGVTVNFTMIAFTNKMTREIRVMGTEGEIWGDFKEKKVYWQRFGGKVNEIDLEALTDDFTGHGGGDARLIYDVIRYFRGDKFDSSSITTLDRSVESHYVAFAAEASRLNEGAPVDPAKFAK